MNIDNNLLRPTTCVAILNDISDTAAMTESGSELNGLYDKYEELFKFLVGLHGLQYALSEARPFPKLPTAAARSFEHSVPEGEWLL